LHFFEAYRAFSGFFRGIGVDFERIEEFFGLLGISEQHFEFAGVEPDAAADSAVINLDISEFEGNHRVFANRTIHKSSPVKTFFVAVYYIRLVFRSSKARQAVVFFFGDQTVGKPEAKMC